MKQALNDANLKINDIDEVVMVGGHQEYLIFKKLFLMFLMGKNKV